MRQLRRIKELGQFTIRAPDGDVGKVEELYFDDGGWFVRYLVVNTGGWLLGRRTLIAPVAVSDLDDSEQILHVGLTRRQVEHSPPVDAEKPISRQYEEEYYKYYGWPPYWTVGAGTGPYVPPARAIAKSVEADEVPTDDIRQSHLRSSAEVTGYYIEARDGEIGHVEDFVIDDKEWAIRYLVVDTRNWWPGKKVLVSPTWIERVSWRDRKVRTDLEREIIKGAPEYDPSKVISPEYEVELFNYYGGERRKPEPSTN